MLVAEAPSRDRRADVDLHRPLALRSRLSRKSRGLGGFLVLPYTFARVGRVRI